MPVPSAITDLSTTPGSNSPSGAESASTADDYFRTHASFIRTLYDQDITDKADLASTASGKGASLVQTTLGSSLEAVAQLVGKRMIWPYLANFGVVGDGVADDTTALNAALTYAGSIGAVVLIQGKHKITGKITIPQGAILAGAAAAQAARISTAEKSPAELICATGSVAYDAVELATGVYASIIGVSVMCGYIAQQGIVVTGAACSIHGCAVNRSNTHGITVNGSVCKITDTHVIYPGQHGIQILAGDCQIQGHCEVQQPNNANANGGLGFTAGTYSCFYVTGQTLQMSGGRSGDDLFRCAHNIHIDGGNAQISDWDISQSPRAGVYLNNSGNTLITGCKIISGTSDATNSCGIYIAGSTTRLTVIGNFFNNTLTVGQGAIKFDAAVTTPSYIVVKSNSVFGPWAPTTVTAQSAFISITDAQKAAAVGCVFENAQFPQALSPQYQDISGSATPTIAFPGNGFAPNCYTLNNASATTITAINGGYPGQMIMLEAQNSNTTIQHTGSALELLSRQNWTMQNGSVLVLLRTGTAVSGGARWMEIARRDGTTSGANQAGLSLGGTVRIYQGTGSPAGVQAGSPGDIYLNLSGGAATTLYVKESGTNTNAGWVAK